MTLRQESFIASPNYPNLLRGGMRVARTRVRYAARRTLDFAVRCR
jgi:hypothetical protein